MELFLHIENGAHFSDDKKYRYALWRIWDRQKPLVMFIGLNPSTANATTDDPTIRRVKAIATNLGYGGVYMMNLFAYVSTDPKKLKQAEVDTVGKENDEWLQRAARECRDIICAWGNFEVHGRDKIIDEMFKQKIALVINKNGSPKHPLYVKTNVVPVNYDTTIKQ